MRKRGAVREFKGLDILSVQKGLLGQNRLFVIGVRYSLGLICKRGSFSIK